MAVATRLARLGRAVTLPETRRLIVAAARSNTLRGLARRTASDRAGVLRDLRHLPRPRDLIRSAEWHAAARELANVGSLFLPVRYVPLGWIATWVATRALRRYLDRPIETR
jgi:hypothetical protein